MSAARRWRPGLLDRYLLHRVMAPLLILLALMVLFLEIERALRLLHELYATGSNLGFFLPLVAGYIPYFINLAVPPAFFIATAAAVARLDDQREFHVMLASGVSLVRIAAPLVFAGLIAGAATVVTSGWLEPIGRHLVRTLRAQSLASGRVEQLRAGTLYRPTADFLLLLDPRGGGARSAFAWHRSQTGTTRTISASGVRLRLADDGRSLEVRFATGQLLIDERSDGGATPRLVSFRNSGLTTSLPRLDRIWPRGRDERELTLTELSQPDRFPRLEPGAVRAELWSRLLRAAMLPLVPLLVLPLAMAGGRGGRIPGVLFAAFLLLAGQYGLHVLRQVGGVANMFILMAVLSALAFALLAAGRMLPSHSPMSSVLGAIGRIVRLPAHRRHVAWSVPGLRLASYLTGRVLGWSLVALLVLLLLLISAELFLLGDAFARRGLGFAGMLTYAALRAPALALQALPAAALAGPVAALALMARRWELVGFRLTGCSSARLLLMALPAPLIVAAATWTVSERVAPVSQQAFLDWWDRDASARGGWLRAGSTLVRLENAQGDGTRLGNVAIFERDGDGRLRRRITAAGALRADPGWLLTNVRAVHLSGGQAHAMSTDRLFWPRGPATADVNRMLAANHAIAAATARAALGRRAFGAEDDAFYRTRALREVSQLLIPLLMLLLAIPIAGARYGPQSRSRRIAWAVGAGALLLVTDGWATVAAYAGMIPAATGVWAAPALFFPIGWAALIVSEK